MAAQQKAKSDAKRGQRNGDRRNGKAWSKGNLTNAHDNRHLAEKKRKGYYGVSLKTIAKRAETEGRSEPGIILDLKEKHEKKIAYRRETPPSVRRERARQIEIRNLRQKLYENGKGLPVRIESKSDSGSVASKH